MTEGDGFVEAPFVAARRAMAALPSSNLSSAAAYLSEPGKPDSFRVQVEANARRRAAEPVATALRPWFLALAGTPRALAFSRLVIRFSPAVKADSRDPDPPAVDVGAAFRAFELAVVALLAGDPRGAEAVPGDVRIVLRTAGTPALDLLVGSGIDSRIVTADSHPAVDALRRDLGPWLLRVSYLGFSAGLRTPSAIERLAWRRAAGDADRGDGQTAPAGGR